eukprot:UN10759
MSLFFKSGLGTPTFRPRFILLPFPKNNSGLRSIGVCPEESFCSTFAPQRISRSIRTVLFLYTATCRGYAKLLELKEDLYHILKE